MHHSFFDEASKLLLAHLKKTLHIQKLICVSKPAQLKKGQPVFLIHKMNNRLQDLKLLFHKHSMELVNHFGPLELGRQVITDFTCRHVEELGTWGDSHLRFL